MIIFIFLIQLIFFLGYPYIFFRFKGIEKKQRTGFFSKKLKKSIWFHAASVGEVNAVKPLLHVLLKKYPESNFVLTTMTGTGQETAKKIDPNIATSFLPFDCFTMMKRFIKKVNPQLIILVETEFWPTLLWLANKNKIPVIVVNGRLSDRSFPHYKRFLFFWKPLWKTISAVNAQSEEDKKRFLSLDFNNVVNAHNLKFCVELPEFERDISRKEIKTSKNDFVIVWGSSRPGEEKLLKSIYHDLKKVIKNLKIVIVPRHLECMPEIESIFADSDYQVFSKLKQQYEILIVDQMGILNKIYALADLVIVGGSFFNFGGHNPLEPAFYKIPIIMGEDFSSCRDSVMKMIENNGILISSNEKLLSNIIFLYKNPEIRKNLGSNAKKTLQENSDSLEKNLDTVVQNLF